MLPPDNNIAGTHTYKYVNDTYNGNRLKRKEEISKTSTGVLKKERRSRTKG